MLLGTPLLLPSVLLGPWMLLSGKLIESWVVVIIGLRCTVVWPLVVHLRPALAHVGKVEREIENCVSIEVRL